MARTGCSATIRMATDAKTAIRILHGAFGVDIERQRHHSIGCCAIGEMYDRKKKYQQRKQNKNNDKINGDTFGSGKWTK